MAHIANLGHGTDSEPPLHDQTCVCVESNVTFKQKHLILRNFAFLFIVIKMNKYTH
jgi:hypothetical protein